ncbi:hypothetical protein NP493_1962g00008 [Ridgeia piscesae]|uniref:Uncharacterized protein n=1 Tax=Ridgeia piscesae TaxID=27915 RepID=A0AAD9N6V7_RIDPI|nr:hypothetical protein NP493_1962g00008 [Ridgeia piscesae]
MTCVVKPNDLNLLKKSTAAAGPF